MQHPRHLSGRSQPVVPFQHPFADDPLLLDPFPEPAYLPGQVRPSFPASLSSSAETGAALVPIRSEPGLARRAE